MLGGNASCGVFFYSMYCSGYQLPRSSWCTFYHDCIGKWHSTKSNRPSQAGVSRSEISIPSCRASRVRRAFINTCGVFINIDLLIVAWIYSYSRIQPRSNRYDFWTIKVIRSPLSFFLPLFLSFHSSASMSSQKDNPVDEELFQFYLQFRVRQIQKSMLLWDDNSEKQMLVKILTSCQQVNGSK